MADAADHGRSTASARRNPRDISAGPPATSSTSTDAAFHRRPLRKTQTGGADGRRLVQLRRAARRIERHAAAAGPRAGQRRSAHHDSSTARCSATSRIRPSRSPLSSAISPEATARRTSPRSASRRRPRRSAWRADPGVLRRLPRVLSRARSRASVVGPGRRAGRTTTSSGSVRASRSTSRRSTPSSTEKSAVFDSIVAADGAVDARPIGSGSGLSRLPSRPHQERRPRLPRACLQQGRVDAAHAAAPDRRRRVLPRPAAVLRRRGGSERPAPRI